MPDQLQDSILHDWLSTLRKGLQARGERRLLVLAGAPQWGRCRLQRLMPAFSGSWLWIGGGQPLVDCAASKPDQVLGGEWDAMVIDGFAGLRPDLLGAASGALRGGGLLILLAPGRAGWAAHRDPDYDAAARSGRHALPGNRFWRRLERLLDHPAVVLMEEHDGALPNGLQPVGEPWEGPRCDEQTAAVAAVLRCARGRAHRPLVVMADRGRGKSATLGLAAAELVEEGRQVAVTGPRPSVCERLFHHAVRTPDDHDPRRKRGGVSGGLRFWPVDELLAALEEGRAEVDLILVDEAAALPVAALQRLARHPRVVFATTVHGYEGSGHGFERRFLPQLAHSHPQWRRVVLTEPMRWSAHDPLEAWVARALLLDAEPAPVVGDAAAIEVRSVSQTELGSDERLLRELFGLLVQAHYRTSPDDLRDLLDGPNLTIWVARQSGAVVGVLLAAAEGNLPASLHEPIMLGQRRIRGHLLPQSLAFHGGQPWALSCRWRRIVRIAVVEPLQRQGVARQLVEACAAAARAAGAQMLGASFAASAPLVRVWRRLGFRLLRIGIRTHAAGGAIPVMVGRALDDQYPASLAAVAGVCAAELPLLLSGPLRGMDASLARALLQQADPRGDPVDRAELVRIADGTRPVESALLPLRRWALKRLCDAAPLTPEDEALIVGRLLQSRDLQQLARQVGLSGSAALDARLRALVRDSLADFAGEPRS